MKRRAVFITYFQSTIQIGLVYQFLLSGYFFPKFDGRLNIMGTFFAFPLFCEKTYEKTYNFYDLFSNILSWFTLSQKFVLWKFLPKKWRLFQNVYNLLFISATLSNICNKTYEKTYLFFYIFSKYHFGFTSSQNLVIQIFFLKKWHRFQYVNQSFVIAATLNNILDKYHEKSFNSCDLLFKFISIFTVSRNFMKTTFWQ